MGNADFQVAASFFFFSLYFFTLFLLKLFKLSFSLPLWKLLLCSIAGGQWQNTPEVKSQCSYYSMVAAVVGTTRDLGMIQLCELKGEALKIGSV